MSGLSSALALVRVTVCALTHGFALRGYVAGITQVVSPTKNAPASSSVHAMRQSTTMLCFFKANTGAYSRRVSRPSTISTNSDNLREIRVETIGAVVRTDALDDEHAATARIPARNEANTTAASVVLFRECYRHSRNKLLDKRSQYASLPADAGRVLDQST